MKRNIFDRLIMVVAGTLVFAGLGVAAEFSADLMQTGIKTLNKGKLYVKGGKIRQEITVGRKQIVITRPDKKLVWTLDPVAKTYMKVTAHIVRGLDDPDVRVRLKKISVAKPASKETVNGYLCVKRQWVTKAKPATTLTEWSSSKLGFVLKTEMKEPWVKTTIEYKNIKVGKVSDSLFEIPKGYRLVATPQAPKN